MLVLKTLIIKMRSFLLLANVNVLFLIASMFFDISGYARMLVEVAHACHFPLQFYFNHV